MTATGRGRSTFGFPKKGIRAALPLLVLVLLALPARSQTPDPPAAPAASWEILDERAADGEQCVVCRIRIHEGNIIELRYKGRTFFVAASMLEDFEANPEHYFAVLQPRGGLFDEGAMETPAMKTGWLIFGLYVLTGLIFGAACSYAALNRDLPALGWFFAGLIANLPALLLVLTRRPRSPKLSEEAPGLTKIHATATPRACPGCGRTNHPSASACSSCDRMLEPTIEPETARA